ncbi:MAG: peptidoglycan editing factor PgeF [Clostridia bacterium]|nr:peptidoglycan editing factor PgeF [Clostridia bacterium]
MFYQSGILLRSSALRSPRTAHGFSTRLGGVSRDPATREMNLAFGREDPDSVVYENIGIFARAVTGGRYGGDRVVCAPQIHSDKIRYVTPADAGDGVTKRSPDDEGYDGFVTDEPGVILTVRVADCVPILFCGMKKDGSPVVAAAHAGWRGTVAGIAARAVERMVSLGAARESIRAAIGPHIGACCFEVREDFRDAVSSARGEDFASRHIKILGGSLHADLTAMNLEILASAGIGSDAVDASADCTACRPDLFHSHRKTGGKRGAMGAAAAILD